MWSKMKVEQLSSVIIILSLIYSGLALDICKDTDNTNCQSCGDSVYPRDEFYRQNCMKSCGVCTGTNIALVKPTNQSSTFFYGSSSSNNAVDGNTDNDWENGSCTHTDNTGNIWWCVDLQQIYNIDNIKLFNRDLHKGRLQGFVIKTSSSGTCNGQGFSSATSCYNDTTSTRQDIYTIDRCNQPSPTSISARTVYVTVSSQYLTLCEVRIFSDLAQCNTGYYSTSSSTCQPCNTCLGDTCDPSNGVCTGECKTGFYGTQCQQSCSDGCLSSECSKSDGRCNACKPDTVGPYCNLTCGTECQPDQTSFTCDRNGRCTNCIIGRYGDRCHMNCSKGCDGGCDRNSGRCTSCIKGRYGDRCDMNCSTGCDGGCDRGNGRCTSCIKGKTGDVCDINCNTDCTVCNQDDANSCTECIDGRWGSSCNKPCSSNCKTEVGTTVGKCNITSGVCSEGCKTGLYGIDCNNDCRSNCKDGLCDQMTGDCINGCLPGKTGPNCATDCEAGSYGDNCTSKCGNCADKTPCDIITGTCGLVGCADGFQGPVCKESLRLCACTAVSPVVSGVIGVLVGVLCGILGSVAVFFLTYHFYKKRCQSNNPKEGIEPDYVYSNTDLNSTTSTTGDTLTTGYQNIPTNTRNVDYVNQSFNTEDNTRNMYDTLDPTPDKKQHTYTTLYSNKVK